MKAKHVMTALVLCLVLSAGLSLPAAAAEVTIVGEVNDTSQIVTTDRVYEVDDTAEGDDLVSNYISQKVKVTGTLRTEDDMTVITVRSFTVVEE